MSHHNHNKSSDSKKYPSSSSGKIKKVSQENNIKNVFIATDDSQAFHTFQPSFKNLH